MIEELADPQWPNKPQPQPGHPEPNRPTPAVDAPKPDPEPMPDDLVTACEVIAELRENGRNLEASRQMWMGIANGAVDKLEKIKQIAGDAN